MRSIIIKKKWLPVIICSPVFFFLIFAWWYNEEVQSYETAGPAEEFEIQMVTTEFKTTTEDGKEIEAYRWDPGTIVIPKNKQVKLKIYGVNGKEHPFMIEGTDIKGTVKKGEETEIDLHFTESGIYRLICLTHSHHDDNGPMVGYIVVN
ncbi:cupredoxin domain-containing protein [Thalassobacillus sp. C254]|uniref:cupredoxin domain-containing protein n=1 Tax=Thalassobacillus sp. C254 TaxID=1225341 RepID=UPI0006CF681B|nr:cupredoxin domain-containing protein [Thalassobacillus sp. C254]